MEAATHETLLRASKLPCNVPAERRLRVNHPSLISGTRYVNFVFLSGTKSARTCGSNPLHKSGPDAATKDYVVAQLLR
jgi:hypothetical protein